MPSESLAILYLVASPIGNLGDMTTRAVETLGSVDFIICEDTRHSRVLLEHHQIHKPVVSMPAFAEAARCRSLVQRLSAGESAAVLTDAGSPGISDPGEALVAAAVAAGISVVPIPGPAALIAALTASGLPTGRFHFLGFLPRENKPALEMLEEVKPLRATLVFYESSVRLVATLERLKEQLGDRSACVARELTKRHEQFHRGLLSALIVEFATTPPRGELVLIVNGNHHTNVRWTESAVESAVRLGLEQGKRVKELSGEVAELSGWSAKDVYQLCIKLRQSQTP